MGVLLLLSMVTGLIESFWLKCLNVGDGYEKYINSQAARESFLHTEGVFRLLSNEDVLKLSIHPPLPPPKILWRIPSCKFRVQGVSDIMYSGELWGAGPPFLSSFVLQTRFYAELIAFIRLIIDYQSLIHYLTCSDWQFKYLRPFLSTYQINSH